MIQIKHHEKLFGAFEVNPFVNKQAELDKALEVYRQQLGLERREERVPMGQVQLK